MWIVYVSSGRAEYVGQKVGQFHFQGVAQKVADLIDDAYAREGLPERHSVRFEEVDE